MVKRWDGDADERFTFIDMNRVEYNANICAEWAGIEPVEFRETSRADQFDYSEANRLEGLIEATADALGIGVSMETAWGFGRTLSHVDFERWESSLWTIYTALGGTGERIDAGKLLKTYTVRIAPDDWSADYPWTTTAVMPGVHPDSECIAYVAEDATLEQRIAEQDALIVPAIAGDRLVSFVAHGAKPLIGLRVKVTLGEMDMYDELRLSASAWTGSGPWTQTVDMGVDAQDVVLGTCGSTSTEQAVEMGMCAIHVAGIDGSVLTVRAMQACPSIDLDVGVLYNEASRWA